MCLQRNHRNGVGENGEELKIFLMLFKKSTFLSIVLIVVIYTSKLIAGKPSKKLEEIRFTK